MPLTLDERLTHLEEELELFKKRLPEVSTEPENWLNQIFGSFKDDPIYEEAMRLGRDFRDAQRPDDTLTNVSS